MAKQLSIYVRTCNPLFLLGKFKPITLRIYDIGGIGIRFFGIHLNFHIDKG